LGVIEESTSRLADIVCTRAEGWPAADLCCEALRSSTGMLAGDRASKAHLMRIYTIRLSRSDRSPDLIGVDRLLTDLDEYPGEELIGFVHATQSGQMYTMFLDEGVTRLVSCFVGRDHRMAPA
jgi:hypothetical protein